jgi:hypothetical protein
VAGNLVQFHGQGCKWLVRDYRRYLNRAKGFVFAVQYL